MRYRGKVVRTHTQPLTTKVEKKYVNKFKHLGIINIKEKINPIKKILAYSAIKIRANPNLPYSILNPDTNSDSPSGYLVVDFCFLLSKHQPYTKSQQVHLL